MSPAPPDDLPNGSCWHCSFRPQSELRCLRPDAVARLGASHRRRVYPVGSRIFRAGSPVTAVYVLTRGLVAIRRTDAEGEATIVRLVFPVCTFDLAAFLREQRHGSDAYVLTEAHVCELDRRVFDELTRDNPDVGRSLMTRLAADLVEVERDVLAMQRRPVRERLLQLILRLAGECASAGARRAFTLPLSRQNMASVLGVRPETLTRTIQQVNGDGLLRVDRRNVVIPDFESLLAAVGE